MRKVNYLLTIVLATTVMLGTTGCKKKGCIDVNADNYDENAKKDDGSCTYPAITVKGGGDDGDVTGAGGTATNTHTWTNNQSTAELNMDLTAASGGSFQIKVTDADGTEVLNETLTAGVGDDSLTKCSSSGTSGTWTVTITLTDFSGDGSFTLSQGC